jgi:hypothetical protein
MVRVRHRSVVFSFKVVYKVLGDRQALAAVHFVFLPALFAPFAVRIVLAVLGFAGFAHIALE